MGVSPTKVVSNFTHFATLDTLANFLTADGNLLTLTARQTDNRKIFRRKIVLKTILCETSTLSPQFESGLHRASANPSKRDVADDGAALGHRAHVDDLAAL